MVVETTDVFSHWTTICEEGYAVLNVLTRSIHATYRSNNYQTRISTSANMLEIYLDPCTVNSRKVLAGLDLMDAPYHYNFISYFEGKQKDPEYVKNINSSATVRIRRAIDRAKHALTDFTTFRRSQLRSTATATSPSPMPSCNTQETITTRNTIPKT